MPDYTFPVVYDAARITSRIGPRNSPIAGASTWHKGIDIAAPAGSPVVAPTDLQIVFAGQASGYGNVIYGVDPSGYQHRFGHLQGFNVQEGATVSAGSQIGTVGATGVATGPHLHYEVRDAAGKLLADVTNRVVSMGRKLASSETLARILKGNPVTGPWATGADFLGDTFGVDILGDGGCGANPICHLKKWLEESDFIERAAIYFLAAIFIIGGIAFLALGYNPKQIIAKAVK